MRIAYVLSWDLERKDGVTKKVLNQVNSWKSFGNDVSILCISKKRGNIDNVIKVNRKISRNPILEYHLKSQAFKKIYFELIKINPDIVYLRSQLYTPWLNKIFKKFRTIVEINSGELLEFMSEGIFKISIFKLLYLRITSPTLLKKASGLVFVTHELTTLKDYSKYKRKSLVLPNAIDIDKLQNNHLSRQYNKIPRLVMSISHQAPWHGLEKIIEFAEHTIGLVEIDVFGIDPLPNHPPNMKFWGFKEFDEYAEYLITRVNIGIGTLSLYKKGLNEASPLKVREYLALGLPTIIGYEDTAFLNKPIPEWILKLPNSPNNLIENKERVIAFIDKMKDYVIPKESLEKYIDSSFLEKKRMEFFEKIVGNKIPTARNRKKLDLETF